MDAPFRAGDLRHGYQAVADNLPNDPRIHQEKGTKKIFFKNFMDARVNEVILPLAARVMDPAQARRASAEGYLAVDGDARDLPRPRPGVRAHRTAGTARHPRSDRTGVLGPRRSQGRRRRHVRAEVAGRHGVLPKERLEEYYASYVAGIFRTVRFGTGEAHGRAEMMEFNYLVRAGRDRHAPTAATASTTRRCRTPSQRSAKELLEQEATGDRARAEAWFAKYDRMPAALTRRAARARTTCRSTSTRSSRSPNRFAE